MDTDKNKSTLRKRHLFVVEKSVEDVNHRLSKGGIGKGGVEIGVLGN